MTNETNDEVDNTTNPELLKNIRIFRRPLIVKPPTDLKNVNPYEEISDQKNDDPQEDTQQSLEDTQQTNIHTPTQIDNDDEINDEEITPIHEPGLEIVGTAHISQESMNTVRDTIYEKRPEIVAIELDPGRYQGLLDDARGIKREQDFDLKQMLKSSNLTVTIVNILLSSMQKKMGREVGVKPGSEMLEAVQIANEVNADIALIDRNINVTLKRTIDGMTWREKLSFVWQLLLSVFMDDDDEEDLQDEIESLKSEEGVEEVMGYLKEESPGGYNALVHERDAYMAYNLKALEDKNVVAVIGAGHQGGLKEYINNPETIPPIESIEQVKESRISFTQIILFIIPVLCILLFVLAYINGIEIQGGIVNYVLFAGGGAFIGSIITGSKIQSAIVAFIVSPITILHPFLAAGWFSGLVEGRLRHVGVDDLVELADFETFSDLWHNKLFRVLVVVIGTNLGCTVGFLLSLNSVFIPYIRAIFGI
ncbi:MAG: TraB/GumN family protein [Methanosphaera sp.]|nr:TraB/GumN family protein [Methanosphaera sp.]